MSGVKKDRRETRDGLELLALSALAAYKASGLVKPGEHMHEEIALRLARRVSKDGGK